MTNAPFETDMIPEHFETAGFIECIIQRGWHWSESHSDRLVHPADDDISIQYDRDADRLTASPKLDALLKLVILTPAGKSKSYWRRTSA
jgi:hypothetical protein